MTVWMDGLFDIYLRGNPLKQCSSVPVSITKSHIAIHIYHKLDNLNLQQFHTLLFLQN
jgi:hypothetical protein